MREVFSDFSEYRDIVFMQDEEAEEALGIFEREGVEQVINFLAEWDCGEGTIRPELPCGTSDDVYQRGDYFLTVNQRIGYIGLCAGEGVEL